MAESPRKQREKEKDKEDTQDKTKQDEKEKDDKDSEEKEDKEKESVKKGKDAPAILTAPKNKTIEKLDSEDEEKEKEKKKDDEKEKKKEREKDRETEREKEKDERSEPTKKKKGKGGDSIRPDEGKNEPGTNTQTPKKEKQKMSSDAKGDEDHNTGTERKKKGEKTGKNDKKKREKKKGGTSKAVPSSHREKEDLSREREPPKLKYKFVTPKDEVELSSLQLEPPLSTNCKRMEEYKIAIEQIHTLLLLIMRRGNGTNGVDNIKSEKGGTAPEKLLKSVMLASVFWSSAAEFQPALYDSIKSNSHQIASAERNLQEKGPKHMKRIKKFVYRQYPAYMELKKDLLKLNKTRPDSIHQKEDLLRKLTDFVKEKYAEAKSSHIAELQSALVEIMLYHRATEKNWYNIAERKSCKSGFTAESFDFSQFFKKGE